MLEYGVAGCCVVGIVVVIVGTLVLLWYVDGIRSGDSLLLVLYDVGYWVIVVATKRDVEVCWRPWRFGRREKSVSSSG